MNPTAIECLLDCKQACDHLGEANALRCKIAEHFDSSLFKMRISSAERALRRAHESLAKLEGPSHSRTMRICNRACTGVNDVMQQLIQKKKPRQVRTAAAKLLRHCERELG